MPKFLKKSFSVFLIFTFLFPNAVFAFEFEPICVCEFAFSSVEAPDDEILIPVYLFSDEYGGVLGITPVTEDIFVWAYAVPYTYDSVGNITKIEDYSSITGKVVNFGYDALYRLTTASSSNASTSPNYLQTWGYNSVGNISTSSNIGDYQYDGHTGSNYANPHAPTSIGSMTLEYDRNGNLGTTTLGSTTWTYWRDYKNQLTQVASGTATTTFAYDHAGNRTRLSTNGNSTTTYPSKFYNVQGATTTKHIYAGNELIAEVIGNGISTSTYIIHTDHLGGVHVVTNASGTAVSTSDYYPYGDLRVNVGSLNEQRRFIGEHYDSGPNLSYLNARYYTGTRGNFLSQDLVYLTVGESNFKSVARQDLQKYLSDPQILNSYSYARDNPVKLIDKSGKIVALPVLLGIGAAGGILSQGIEDYITGNDFQWENYAGAAIGGMAAVTTSFYAPGISLSAFGAVSQGVGNIASQGLKLATGQQEGFSTGEVAGRTLFGYGAGKIPVPGIVGVTVGKNSFSAITNQIVTKYANSTINNFTAKTAGKIAFTQGLNAAKEGAVIGGGISAGQTVSQQISVQLQAIATALAQIAQIINVLQSSQSK